MVRISKGTGGDVDSDTNIFPDPYVRNRYIEAIIGAQFEIRVRLNRSFKLYGHHANDAVKVLVVYDGQAPGWCQVIANKKIERKWAESRKPEYILNTLHHYDPISRQWQKGETTFGSLMISKRMRLVLLL